MANLTLTIDEEILRRARIRALEQNTSVNALVRGFLESFAGSSDVERAAAELLELSDQSHASSGPAGRTWTRDEIYEDRVGRFGER